MNRNRLNGSVPDRIDYDLHGLAGIRLLDASPGDVAAVARQLGPIQSPLDREPDIVIRFVDRLEVSSRVCYLGLDDAGFTDDAFLVLRGKYGARARVQIAFQNIGKQCEFICERGLQAVPLLLPVLNLTALSNGAIPLHASAFSYKGTGVLATGWSKGGKTETLLAFMARGAGYIGDEWVYISGDGERMYGIPEPVRIWDWYLKDLPQYYEVVGRGDRAKLRALGLLSGWLDRAAPKRGGLWSPYRRLMGRVVPLLKRQQYVQIEPRAMFGQNSCLLAGSMEKVLLVISHDAPHIRIRPVDSREVAGRMVFSLQQERADFMSYYLKFRFAFPEARNDLIEGAEHLERELLLRVLAGKEIYAVYHPYPVPIPALFDAIQPLVCRSRESESELDHTSDRVVARPFF